MSSVVRQNYTDACEAAVNKQINMELYAMYVYMSMSSYFNRDDVALLGMAKFCKESSDEEKEHAEKLMKYQNSRGGRVVYGSIEAPSTTEYGGCVQGLTLALDLEKKVNKALLDLHKVADSHNDPHLADFIEGEYLTEQVEAIKKLGDMITRAKRAGPGLGEFMFDKELQ